MNALAIFGGSFNPPHVAHQMVCLWVAETQPVDAVWLIPAYRHPFHKPLADFDDRVAMCELAAQPLARVDVCPIERELAQEAQAGRAGRTLDLVQALRARYPGVTLRLIVGSDILAESERWYRWHEVERLAPPIVVPRAGHGPGVADAPCMPDVSSTEVRARIARGESAVPLVSRGIMEYIAQRGLYR